MTAVADGVTALSIGSVSGGYCYIIPNTDTKDGLRFLKDGRFKHLMPHAYR